jgi:hypothetical protein
MSGNEDGTAPAGRDAGRGGTGTGLPQLSRQPRVAMAWLKVVDGRMTAEAFDASGW